jgi:hypothetical protein
MSLLKLRKLLTELHQNLPSRPVCRCQRTRKEKSRKRDKESDKEAPSCQKKEGITPLTSRSKPGRRLPFAKRGA